MGHGALSKRQACEARASIRSCLRRPSLSPIPNLNVWETTHKPLVAAASEALQQIHARWRIIFGILLPKQQHQAQVTWSVCIGCAGELSCLHRELSDEFAGHHFYVHMRTGSGNLHIENCMCAYIQHIHLYVYIYIYIFAQMYIHMSL